MRGHKLSIGKSSLLSDRSFVFFLSILFLISETTRMVPLCLSLSPSPSSFSLSLLSLSLLSYLTLLSSLLSVSLSLSFFLSFFLSFLSFLSFSFFLPSYFLSISFLAFHQIFLSHHTNGNLVCSKKVIT